MRPYWEGDGIQLFLGDCREVLPALGMTTADCVVADPPYGETSLPWDRWPDGWLDTAAQVTRSLWCFGSLRMYLKHAAEFGGWKLSQDVIWRKPHGTSRAADRFKRVHEQPTHWYQGRWGDIYHDPPRVPHYGPNQHHGHHGTVTAHLGTYTMAAWADDGARLMQSIIDVPGTRCHAGAIHPTEKPTGILRPLIEYACPPGGLVIDPFAGSGSTLDAARQAGRRAIGVEEHEPYAEAAARRLDQGILTGPGPKAASTP